jgi:branched-chain amino acid transport system ATP-binding protein
VSAPILASVDLHKSFGGVRATHGVTLAIDPGEIRALIGPNGAGKTTLFNLLTGHLRPDSGSIRLAGREVAGRSPVYLWRQGMSRTFQIPAVFSNLSVLDNVVVPILARDRRSLDFLGRLPPAARARAAVELERVGLASEADRRARTLAYGDLKRLELAIALASDPQILLLDEPTSGMAPAERHALMALVGASDSSRSCSRSTTWTSSSRSPGGSRCSTRDASSPRAAPTRSGPTPRSGPSTWAPHEAPCAGVYDDGSTTAPGGGRSGVILSQSRPELQRTWGR